MSDFSAIFSPIRVGGHRFKNRLVALPVYTGYAHPGGSVSGLMLRHYTRLSRSGAAMVVVANAAVSAGGIISDHNLRIDQDRYIPGLSRLADAIKAGGAVACLQLNHGGRFSRSEKPLLPAALGKSNLAFNIASLKSFMEFFPVEKRVALTRRFLKLISAWTRGMSAAERDRTAAAFGSAAARARAAGFDMVELHGAGGYLLCQFLSSFTNRGPAERPLELTQRAVFPLAVIREIKRSVPDGFPIGYRLILREWVPDGIDPEDAIAFARLLEKEEIAYLSASVATYNSMFSQTVRQKMARPAYLKTDVAALTKAVDIPTIISGRVTRPDLAHRLIKEGVAALIGLGRPLRTDPRWIARATRPGPKTRTCINCNWCIKRVVLDEGFNCRRWPRYVQEKTDLAHKLLSRNYKSLFVAAGVKDLARFQTALPYILPDRQNLKMAAAPTLLVLRPDAQAAAVDDRAAEFISAARRLFDRHGRIDTTFHQIMKHDGDAYEQQVYATAREGNHGQILLAHHSTAAWHRKVAYRARGKIVALVGPQCRLSKVMVPIDLSISTLLMLMFLHQTYARKKGVALHFIHVLAGPEKAILHRWTKMKKMVGMREDTPLQTIRTNGDIAGELFGRAEKEGFDTIMMGRRGQSRIKKWLLGSVSARLLQRVTDQTLFLID